ncbi:Spy/CpxP family protein refolding chaperone [Brachymonas sp. G13]|uniref:Spy/CpxP family protein refolding chaperone n=1 Tax=Brachymonas wangyanguii TaxID=3130163 RepID=UPI00307D0325
MTISKMISKTAMAIALTAGVGLAGVAHAQQGAAPMQQAKAALKITAAQEGAWNSFMSTYGQDFRPSATPSAKQFNAMNTTQRIAFLKQRMSEESAFMNRRYDANLALYNALDANQKKVFDDMTAQPEPQPRKAPAKKK